MRIISGTSGGIPIKVPKDTTRPTTDRVRESVFSILGTALIDASVLDLFAGSGSLGLESLSRGAQSAIFVDESRAAGRIIEENLAKTGLSENATVRTVKVERFLQGLGPGTSFDLIFADPPYARDDELAAALTSFLSHEKLPNALNRNGLLILETCSRSPLPQLKSWSIEKDRTYGETRVTFLKPLHSEA